MTDRDKAVFIGVAFFVVVAVALLVPMMDNRHRNPIQPGPNNPLAPPMSPEQRELIERVHALVQRNFGGSVKKCFDHYDCCPNDGQLNRQELANLLSDAGVGNWFTRSRWVEGIISALDDNRDGLVSWQELSSRIPREVQ